MSFLSLVGDETLIAPLCLDALSARVAEEAGFKRGYLSGSALCHAHAVSEALLSTDELCALFGMFLTDRICPSCSIHPASAGRRCDAVSIPKLYAKRIYWPLP